MFPVGRNTQYSIKTELNSGAVKMTKNVIGGNFGKDKVGNAICRAYAC